MTLRFDFDLPDECHCHYDANQGTVVVKNKSGQALTAIRDVKSFSTSGLDIAWSEEPSL